MNRSTEKKKPSSLLTPMRAITPIISKVLPVATPTQAGSLCYTNTVA
jgi:hypothetical protein